MTAGFGESWPPRSAGDITLNVLLAVIISMTSCGMPLASACRAFVDTRSLKRAIRVFISAWLGVFVFGGMVSSFRVSRVAIPLRLYGQHA